LTLAALAGTDLALERFDVRGLGVISVGME
jgi:hypothetical protein